MDNSDNSNPRRSPRLNEALQPPAEDPVPAGPPTIENNHDNGHIMPSSTEEASGSLSTGPTLPVDSASVNPVSVVIRPRPPSPSAPTISSTIPASASSSSVSLSIEKQKKRIDDKFTRKDGKPIPSELLTLYFSGNEKSNFQRWEKLLKNMAEDMGITAPVLGYFAQTLAIGKAKLRLDDDIVKNKHLIKTADGLYNYDRVMEILSRTTINATGQSENNLQRWHRQLCV